MKIKPCPFCGNQENPVRTNTRVFGCGKDVRVEKDFYLECDNCELIIGNDRDYDQWGDNFCDFSTEEEALKFWNNRDTSTYREDRLENFLNKTDERIN